MAIAHALPGQPIDVEPLGSRLHGEKTVALFKSEDLEVMRIVLQAGKSLPTHRVGGEITIHCIEGSIDVVTGSGSQLLRAGQLLFLLGAAPHAVTAIEDASALVTVALRK